ncbi:MAG: alpha/beta hydrolase, partial [Myxococcaceae bacterium]
MRPMVTPEHRFLVDGVIPVLVVHPEPRPGPAVVVLHGLGASAEVQRKELVSLAGAGFTAVGVDAPHHGLRRDGWFDEMAAQSGSHVRFLRLLTQAIPEVTRVVEHLVLEGHGPIGLVGISMGAYTALGAAARADARVAATVSILGSPDWSPRDGQLTDELRELLRRAPINDPAGCARAPLLLFNAGRDINVSAEGSRRLAARIHEEHPGLAPQVTYVEYPESEHLMRAEDWDDLWRRTLAFLHRWLG